MEQKQSALQIHAERAARLSGADKEGWLDLALWCKDQGLDTKAREAFLRVLALDPANSMAQAGIGKIWMNNRWLSDEEAHRARGDVLFEGSWVSPEEREDRIRERAERRADESARREADARVSEAEARAREADAAARRAEADANGGGIPYGWGGGYVNGGGYASGRGNGAGRNTGGYAPAATGHRGAHATPVAVSVTRDTGRTSHGEAPPRRN